jgi:hypothetical protein
MTLAFILVIAAALALVFILSVTLSRNQQISRGVGLAAQIQPIDVEAFRTLVDPLEDDYLRRRLPAAEFRLVLVSMGQSALSANDAQTVDAARQLVDNALLLRRNAALALIRIYVALAWPNSGMAVAPILHGYEQLNGSAMLLGRLQNPAAPIRISAAL